HATLDTHHRNDISHNVAWRTGDGLIPAPFTIVSRDDILLGRLRPAAETAEHKGRKIRSLDWALAYTAELEASQRFQLCLWPVHCQIGTWGHNLVDPVSKAFDAWCDQTSGLVNFHWKGQWPWSEHYSAMRAEVPDPHRPETCLNEPFLNALLEADRILWAGWAGSHCLRFTALDAINACGPGKNTISEKSVFFHDASAPVADIPEAGVKFSDQRRAFLDEVQSRGATLTTTDQFMP
ncbi:MAG: hypothetical protein RJA81_1461, partial [Planctomycetota bacterium]